MSKARIKARHRATDCISQVSPWRPVARNPEVAETGASDLEEYCSMPQRTSSGRNESHNPNAQASGDRLQSILKEDEDVINSLSPGVKAYSELGDEGGRKLQEDLREMRFHTISRSTLQRCAFFARDCRWASFQMKRCVKTYITGCQNQLWLRKHAR